MKTVAAAVSLACLIAGAAPARAADLAAETPVVAGQEGWIVTLKATGVVAPRFEGTRSYGPTLFPGLSIRKPGQPWKFGAPDDGFGFAVIDTEWLQFGPVARLRAERDSSDVKRFRGMDDIKFAIEPGAFLEVYPLSFLRVRGELRRGVRGHSGLVGNVAADVIERYDRVTVSVGPRLELGDHSFMDTYFGVSGSEAAKNGHVTPYKADGGVKSVGAAAAATYDWTPSWSTTAFARYNRLTGDAARSPIARKIGTKDAFTLGLGLAYSFAWNGL